MHERAQTFITLGILLLLGLLTDAIARKTRLPRVTLLLIFGFSIGRAESLFSRWMGAALLPQAGVALGMALVAAQRRPDLGEVILTVVVASTVLFEVIGPILTRIALVRMGEVPRR